MVAETRIKHKRVYNSKTCNENGQGVDMSKFFRRFSSAFRKKRPLSYEEQRQQASSASRKKRLTLAADTQTNKEILYYLAESDPDPKVRKAVVENEAMPMQVSPKLAKDADEDVRLALARRLIGLLPQLSDDMHSQLYAFAVQALGTLALDEVLKIRVALSSTLKDHAYAPPKVANKLARDVEQEVSEPILRFCAALSDEDLIDILRGHPASWAVQAIAARDEVAPDVSEAVIETDDVPGGRVLLENSSADITDDLLQAIVERARNCPEWHGAIAARPNLPSSVALEMADFVDTSVREILMKRDDFDDELAEEVAEIFKRRMAFAFDDDSAEGARDRLKRLIQEDRLNEETLSDAIGMRDYALVNDALAHLAKTNVESVTKVIETQKPRSIVSLCWKAGLSMRMALSVQKDVAHVNHKELLYPKGGTDYPLSEEEMREMLDILGIA